MKLLLQDLVSCALLQLAKGSAVLQYWEPAGSGLQDESRGLWCPCTWWCVPPEMHLWQYHMLGSDSGVVRICCLVLGAWSRTVLAAVSDLWGTNEVCLGEASSTQKTQQEQVLVDWRTAGAEGDESGSAGTQHWLLWASCSYGASEKVRHWQWRAGSWWYPLL